MSILDGRGLDAKPRDERASFLRNLAASPLGFSAGDRIDAAKAWDKLARLRAEWLRDNRRHLPSPDALDRQRYAIPRTWEARRG